MSSKVKDVCLVVIVAVFVAVAMAVMSGCGKSPTAPDVQDSAVSTSGGQTTVSDTTPTAVAPAAPASALDIKVRDNGTVVNNTDTTFTACLFDAPYGEGKLVHEWRAKPGATTMDYKGTDCAGGVGQVDVFDGNKCPDVPHGMVILAANPNVTIPGSGAAECTECEPGEWEVIEDSGEVWGEWGECPKALTVEKEVCTETVTECLEGGRTVTESNKCETRTRIDDLFDEREVEREVPCPCEEEWIEQDMVIENLIECDECGGERTWDEVIYEVNSCTKEQREKSRTPKSDPCEKCGPVCELASEVDFTAATFGGSPTEECSRYGGFVCKIEDGHTEGNCDDFVSYDTEGTLWTIGVPFDTTTALVKSGIYLDPQDGGAGVNDYLGWKPLFFARKDISHVTFCGCPE